MTDDDAKGWRAIPPALLLALVAWIAYIATRAMMLFAPSDEPLFLARMSLTFGGINTACYLLALIGTLELATRLTGRVRLGVQVAAGGFGFALAVEVLNGLMKIDPEMWRHTWLAIAMPYGWFATWLIVPVGFSLALWRHNRTLAIVGLVVVLVTNPPPAFAQQLFGGIAHPFNAILLDNAMRMVRIAAIVAMVAKLARGRSVADRRAVAGGLRSAGRAMWFRVIASVVVALLTIVAVGSRASAGAFEILKLAMIAAAVVNLVSLVMFGVGAARAAHAGFAELPRWPLVLAAGGALWCAGVGYDQLPHLYRQLYKGSESFGRVGDFTQVLVIAVPVVLIVAGSLLAIAIGMLARARNAIDLGQHAQGKGVGFAVMMLTSLAITQWMMPAAGSKGSLGMLMLLAALAGMIAMVMLARLCALAAEEIEREPGLPTASVVSDST